MRLLAAILLSLVPLASRAADLSTPLVIGETFEVKSAVLSETRRINVYLPSGYEQDHNVRLPVLYMPDGGIGEDFVHVAGLVQVLSGNGSMRPFILVGIENTERRRDLTGPTEIEKDREIAPRVGGSAKFRQFIRSELMPQVEQRYRTTGERAIVGESLAGLFVVETLVEEPQLFDTYIAFDPSLWWNDEVLVRKGARRLREYAGAAKTLYVATSSEPTIVAPARRFLEGLRRPNPQLRLIARHLPEETHATVYHPAALTAFRLLFAPKSK